MRSTTTTLQLPVVSVQSLLDTAGSALAAPHLHPDAVAMLLSLAGQSPRNTHFALEFTVPPQDVGRLEEVREAVEAQFKIASQLTNVAFWLALGLISAWLFRRNRDDQHSA